MLDDDRDKKEFLAAGKKSRPRVLASRLALGGGMLIVLQAIIHTVGGLKVAAPERDGFLVYSWFALGFALLVFGGLAMYAAWGLSRGEHWGFVVSMVIAIATLLVLIPPVVTGLGYPVAGIAGGALLLIPIAWKNSFES